MRTDWALVRRLAFELASRLRGARVQDAGLLPDGRPAIQLWSQGSALWLCLDLFGSPPVVTLEDEAPDVADAPGFTRSLARALHGAVLADVEAGEHDRLLKLSFRTRSRFGVPNEIDLYIELVPRFGNAVLVKSAKVVSAYKEFTPAQSARATNPGSPYELPPLPSLVLPRLVEQSGVDAQTALERLESDAVLTEPLFVYRRNGTLLQAHLLALPQLEGDLSRDESLLDLLAEDRAQRLGEGESARAGQRRDALQRRIAQRLQRIETALRAIAARESEMERADELRREGEAIYATLHELDAQAQSEAKDRAAKIFARYKKLTKALPHADALRQSLSSERDGVEMLLWESQRAPDADLSEIESAFALTDRRRSQRKSAPIKPKRRAPLLLRTERGSRILVGRSPLENADLTFRVARPNDLWFHARGVPGAHVILARDDRAELPVEDVELAASLAAGHSKARESAKVTVDYTPRKHVRKRPDSPPGLVFYTEAKSITVVPKRD